jgi:carbonic anhydrase
MDRRAFLGGFGGLALCPLCAESAFAVDWGWSGPNGPEHWGSLPGYGTCSTGTQQSPIDLGDAIEADLPALEMSWRRSNATIVNPGYTIRVNMPGGSLLRVGRVSYQMVEFHFHAPSEHAINGKRAAMEAHFVHQQTTGGRFGPDPVHGGNDWQAEPQTATLGFGVVGIFIEPGGTNAAFAAIAKAMPQQPGGQVPITVDPAAMLPRSRHYWNYAGSLTTPACSETVTWMVLREPLRVAQADIDRYQALYPMSARPLQPKNRRFVLQSGFRE